MVEVRSAFKTLKVRNPVEKFALRKPSQKRPNFVGFKTRVAGSSQLRWLLSTKAAPNEVGSPRGLIGYVKRVDRQSSQRSWLPFKLFCFCT